MLRTLGAGPTTISGLAERLEITKQGASQIVDDMERRGYVERRPDPADARAKLLHLTARGEAALQAARKFHQAYERKLRRRFGDEAIDTVRGVLTEMAGEAQISTPHFRAVHVLGRGWWSRASTGARCGASARGSEGLNAEHRGLCSRAARCRAECRAVGAGPPATTYAKYVGQKSWVGQLVTALAAVHSAESIGA